MRSIFVVLGMFVVGTGVGCADVLGIEPWEDKQLKGSSSGGGDPGQGGGSAEDSTAENSASSGMIDPCHDGVQNGAETGVDCGGGACEPCAYAYGCSVDADCGSGYCPASRGYCIINDGRAVCGIEVMENPTCGDCVKNGAETDVDCGGECFPCRVGKTCTNDAECWSGSCSSGICAAGPTNTRCFSNADCASGKCAVATVPECKFDNCCE